MVYKEIWNIEPLQSEMDYLSTPLIVGILFILLESIIVYSRSKWGENSILFNTLNAMSRPKYPHSLIFFPIGIILVIFGIYLIIHSKDDCTELKKELHNSQKEIAEGEVVVEFKQPREGHTEGDIIHIGNKTFELSTYYRSDYYHEAISTGGYLKDGKKVRITYIPTETYERSQYRDGKIVKIEIKE